MSEPKNILVRIKIQACGVHHGDSVTKGGLFPNIEYPRVPGHEIIGLIDAVGSDVIQCKTGQLVGVGWFAGNCSYRESCRRGDFVTCQYAKVPEI